MHIHISETVHFTGREFVIRHKNWAKIPRHPSQIRKVGMYGVLWRRDTSIYNSVWAESMNVVE